MTSRDHSYFRLHDITVRHYKRTNKQTNKQTNRQTDKQTKKNCFSFNQLEIMRDVNLIAFFVCIERGPDCEKKMAKLSGRWLPN